MIGMKKILIYLNMGWSMFVVPLVFVGISTPITLLCAPLTLKWRLRIIGPFWRAFAWTVLHLSCWSRVHAEDHRQTELRVTPPRGLYISNHQSYLDIPLMLSQYQVLPIMKKEVLYIPIFGVLGWLAGALVVSRGSRGSRKRVFIQARKRLVEDQFSLQYYPEGTRSKSGQPKSLQEIKANLIEVAYDSGVPVIPISMWGTHKVISPQGLLFFGQPLGIITHKARIPSDYSDVDSFIKDCWDDVVKGHAELQAKLRS
jgi:1-acyl-sn-glycerol-3-phosphate acyltransferase